ncbi:GNAT family N-acetyltransferase [Peribacillus castrilensis]|uniref:GNAT family N-acetyltransferase n=1 Tax=Bacillaceae TaxID=186817 RepID=UPI00069DF1AF|nr:MULTISPECIES: GNAT family N-acetyltransferase [Bacillaceae]MCF7620414.1 GNAT family N-acetyltransferase [Peribacillus frigoritolerans]MCP1155967.1 GNAT family N-acetyltransferase [Peribacillus frigoritolerans]MCT1391207.1 GNAT family N-acetyltransferase [Peribacillus frigoritolerans]PAL03690.1 N-acetyltransferase [Peribacillus simplex]PRA86887.1 N-acetyltransferase [Peribacillus simplex]
MSSISIYHNKNLIGFGRIISDGIYQTLICDVMVDAEYQKTRHWKKSNDIITKSRRKKILSGFNYLAQKGKQDFYKKLGFEAPESEAPGMSLFL